MFLNSDFVFFWKSIGKVSKSHELVTFCVFDDELSAFFTFLVEIFHNHDFLISLLSFLIYCLDYESSFHSFQRFYDHAFDPWRSFSILWSCFWSLWIILSFYDHVFDPWGSFFWPYEVIFSDIVFEWDLWSIFWVFMIMFLILGDHFHSLWSFFWSLEIIFLCFRDQFMNHFLDLDFYWIYDLVLEGPDRFFDPLGVIFWVTFWGQFRISFRGHFLTPLGSLFWPLWGHFLGHFLRSISDQFLDPLLGSLFDPFGVIFWPTFWVSFRVSFGGRFGPPFWGVRGGQIWPL